MATQVHLYRFTQPHFTTRSLPNRTWLDWLSVILPKACMTPFILVSFMCMKPVPCGWGCPFQGPVKDVLWPPEAGSLFSGILSLGALLSSECMFPQDAPFGGWGLTFRALFSIVPGWLYKASFWCVSIFTVTIASEIPDLCTTLNSPLCPPNCIFS